MTVERDTARIVRSWLRADEHESADRVLQTVLSRLDTTPQRRSWMPARRATHMQTRTIAILAAATVLFVAVAGYGGLISTPEPTATPVVTPTPPPKPAVSGSPALEFPPSGALAPGRHSIVRQGVAQSFTIPTGEWSSDGSIAINRGEEGAPSGLGFIFWTQTPMGIFSDPCRSQRAPSIGPDRAALAAAIGTIDGVDVLHEPTEVTVGGRPATSVAITLRDDIDCAPNTFQLWYSAGHARYASQPGLTIWTWIIDVDGTLIWIDGETYEGAEQETLQAVQDLIDSISFD